MPTEAEVQVAKILHNPVYCGMGPFQRIVTDDAFIKSAEVCVEREGLEAYLRQMLAVLRESLEDEPL